MGPVFKNDEERCMAKKYQRNSLVTVVSKVFGKIANNRLVDYLEKCGLFLIFSIVLGVLGLLDQLQFFWQLHLIELPGLLISYLSCST